MLFIARERATAIGDDLAPVEELLRHLDEQQERRAVER
jgi:hypothetical protein